MKTRKYLMIPAAAILLTFLVSGATTSGMAQAPKPSPGKMPQHQEAMKGMQDTSGMMGEPQHVLAMAYRDNVVTFAQALGGQVKQAKAVNLDLARPAVAEMRRSFDLIQQYHQAHMTMMRDHPNPAMSGAMQEMETHLSALGEHLTALESEVNASTPDPKKVWEQTAEILKQCGGMSAMPAKAKPPQMN